MDCDCCGFEINNESEEVRQKEGIVLCADCVDEYDYMRGTMNLEDTEDWDSIKDTL